jgi:hypothetical protein
MRSDCAEQGLCKNDTFVRGASRQDTGLDQGFNHLLVLDPHMVVRGNTIRQSGGHV